MRDANDDILPLLRAAPELQQMPSLVPPLAELRSANRASVARGAAHTTNMHAAQSTATEARKKQGKHWWDHVVDYFTGTGGNDPVTRGAVKAAKSAKTAAGKAAHVYTHAEDYDPTQPVKNAFDHREQLAESTLPILDKASQQAGAGAFLNTAQTAPLHEVTHQYRALRDIYDRHGIKAGLGETLAILLGAGGGALLAGGEGAILGSELVAGATQRTLFQDSWDRTATGEAYRDAANKLVSPGRDAARVLGLSDGTLAFTALSAIGDGLFTLTADPLAVGVGLGHGFNATEEAAGGLLGRWRGDTVLKTPADIDDLLVRRPKQTNELFRDLANKQASQISEHYPQFQSIARDLGEAKSPEHVADVFRDALEQPEIIGTALPSRVRCSISVLGPTTPKSNDTIGRLAAFERRVRTKLPMDLDRTSMEWSARKVDPASDTSFEAMRAALKMTNRSDRAIDSVMQRIIETDDIGLRRMVFKNAMRDSVLAMLPKDADPDLVLKLEQHLGDEMGGVGGMEGGHYGYDAFGRNRSAFQTTEGSTTAALVSGQRGDLALPDYTGLVRSVREVSGGAKALFGRVDDFAFQRLIRPFKSLALATGGFALRVGTAELIPAAVRNGVLDTIRASATAKAAQWGEKLNDDEIGHIQAAVVKLMRGPAKFIADPEDLDLATRLVLKNNGSVVSPAVRAGEFTANAEMGMREANRINLYRAGAEARVRTVETGRFQKFASGGEDFPLYWQRAFREFANDPGIQEAAAAYRDAYEAALREKVVPERAGGFVETTSRTAGQEPVAALPSAVDGATSAAQIVPVEGAAEATSATATRTVDEAVKIATREAIKADIDYLRNRMDPRERSDFMRSTVPAEAGMDPIESWARERVEVMKGLTHAQPSPENQFNPTPHVDLLDAMGRGHTPDAETFEAIPEHQQPIAVKGRVTEPVPNDNLVARIANLGWRKVIDPTINTLGREHQYLLSVKKFYARYQPAIDAGIVDEDEALMHAQIKATQDVIRFVHNPHERTQFAQLMRNVAPFYFAQEQSYRRLGRLLATDPAAFRRYQIMQMRFVNYSHQQADEDGVAYAVLPGLGWLDEGAVRLAGAVGIPMSPSVPNIITGNVHSLQTVFPFTEGDTPIEAMRPSFSVLVTTPVRLIENLFPESAAVHDYGEALIGPAANSGNIAETIIPNTMLRNLFKVGESVIAPERISSQANATIQALQYKQNVAASKWIAAGHTLHTGAPDDPFEKGEPHYVPTSWEVQNDATVMKDFIERVRNQTRISNLFAAILSEGLPTAPRANVSDYGLKAEYQKYIDKYGIIEGADRMLADHPNATPYTVFASDFPKGVPISPYHQSQQFYDEHRDLFKKYPGVAGYLIPDAAGAKYDPAVYQEQIALGLREKKAPKQLVEDMYVSEGFNVYAANKAAHDEWVAEHADDEDALKVENQNWRDWVHNVAARQNPVWWRYFTSQDREERRNEELNQLRVMVTDPRVPNSPLKRGIAGLIRDLDTQLTILEDGKLDRWTGADRQAAVDAWLSYLDGVKDEQPELTTIINRLFSHMGAD